MPIERDALIDYMEIDLGVDTADIDDDSKLFSTGIIDSFALVSLMTFIETSTGNRIPPGDVVLENFDSVGRIMAYISRTNA